MVEMHNSDHSADDSDHSADASDHSADASDNSADDSNHSTDASDHSADDSDHSADDSDHNAVVIEIQPALCLQFWPPLMHVRIWPTFDLLLCMYNFSHILYLYVGLARTVCLHRV